jgi:Zn-dependent peptidase ImmA (M78 family)
MDRDLSAQCLTRAAELTLLYASAEPPFSLDELTSKYDVSEIRYRPLDKDARLLEGADGYVIEVNSIFPRVRQRLSLAHEIGHLIMGECSGQAPSSFCDPAAEKLCNNIAGILLVPDSALVAYLNRSPVFEGWEKSLSAVSVLNAAGKFAVSVELMAKRIFRDLRVAPERIAVIWRYTENTRSSSSSKQLRIAAAWHSTSKAVYVPVNKTASDNSLVFRAYATGRRSQGREIIDIGAMKREFFVDAAAFPSFSIGGHVPSNRAVLSLLTPA